MMHGCVSDSEAQTRALGKRIGSLVHPDQVIALIGPLGAGKTQFAKGVAEGLEVADRRVVNSPSYVIVNEYDGRLHLYHLDAYRLAGPGELEALGFEDMCHSGGVVLVEWADRVRSLFPDDHLTLTLTATGLQRRRLDFAASGRRSVALLDSFARSCA